MTGKLSLTRKDPNTGSRQRVVNRSTAPMRAVLKQVSAGSYENPLVIEFPFGPVDVKYSKLTPVYSEIKRPSMKPLLVRTMDSLRKVTFTALIADKSSGGKRSVEDSIQLLENISIDDVDCEFIYGLSALPFRVRVTQMDVNSRYRNHEGELTQANVSIQLTEVPAFDPLFGDLGPVTPVGLVGKTPVPSRVVEEDEGEDTEPFNGPYTEPKDFTIEPQQPFPTLPG